jgi:hypothetical protein
MIEIYNMASREEYWYLKYLEISANQKPYDYPIDENHEGE